MSGPTRLRVPARNSTSRSFRCCSMRAPEPDWHYRDPQTGVTVGRSEGLALASLRMFEAGVFSADPRDPLRADAERLATLSGAELAEGFQVGPDNPMGGFEGRAALLARLGRTSLDQADVFATRDAARPGGLFDWLARYGSALPAPAILRRSSQTSGVDLAQPYRCSAVCHSATPGGTPPSGAAMQRTVWCRCTSCRSG